MNRKQLTLLIVLGAVLGGLGYWVYNKKQSSYERGSASEEGQKVLAGLSASAINDVAQISIKQGTNELNLARVGEHWTVKERGGYPANFNTISDTVKKLWDLKVTRVVEVGPSRLPTLKLTQADGTLVDMKDDKGKSIAALTLGMQTSKESREESPFGGGGSFPNGRYVMRGDDVKTVALVSDPLNVDAKAEDWLNKDWFKVEKPKSVAVVTTNATNNWKMVRETESGEWKFAQTNANETLDSGKASGLNFLLSSPSFNDVVVDPKSETTGLDKATVATIETFDGFTYTVKLGKIPASEENYAMQISIAANLPKERTLGKDEKPEDKAKLDKEFADKQKPLEEKLKNGKAFEKWTYVVPKWTVENLLKERKDFLAEKKEDKPEAAAPDSEEK
ncbi:MAG TPA: DUF4340 domain-containing protein [Candidatus Limnocylindria bacterium]|nr:DUF4340 domain-containing protein [Candidatus Limnocylindria bacterium]